MMIARLAQFANDSYYLWRSPHSAGTKAKLWFHLVRPSSKMLGFEITYFSRASLVHLYKEIFARQYYYFKAATDSPAILDCGANIGMATLYFKWLYPKARIQAFEPDPQTFAVLDSNIVRNRLTDVVTQNCALWNSDGEIEFFVDKANPGSQMMSADATRLQGEGILVPSQKLSKFINGPIDFLKLDVEGAENAVLSDLISSGKIHSIRNMVVEYHHHVGAQRSCLADFLGQLETNGFDYQVHASLWPVTSQGVFQDLLIGAYQTRP